MSVVKVLAVVGVALLLVSAVRVESPKGPTNVVLAVHGGAGGWPKEKMTEKERKPYADALRKALEEGYRTLKSKDNSLDAVEAAIKVLEDSPLFNAGKGAVFTHEGRNELDASIMDGQDRWAGAVAGVTRLKNPISAARAVMEKSDHVLLAGEGADRFAISKGVEEVNPVYFWTEHRWKQLQKKLREEKEGGGKPGKTRGVGEHGTVGAVALDNDGNLAAGTSTGGLVNKRHGRVGDSPIIGAGTYAENGVCAVSCTGHGEFFMRHVGAYDVAARMKYAKKSVWESARAVLDGLPKGRGRGGVGGLIALDARGNLAMPYNTARMYRGYVTGDGKVHVAVGEKFVTEE
jgi:L-asparaginase / beta-aspartyl-peptidase